MSSGIDWQYAVSNAKVTDPPVKYLVGTEWASGESSQLTVGCLKGLEAVRTAYSQLPGLGYNRHLWLGAKLSGPILVADAASRYLLDLAARRIGKRAPLTHGCLDPEAETIGRWLQNNGFVCGEEIAAHAGLDLGSRFLDGWEQLAIAASEWPKSRWGVCAKVTTLKVVALSDNRELDRYEAAQILDAAESWARAVDLRSASAEAGIELANLLRDEVVAAAVAVTRKEGSISGLRHALRVTGYQQ
ncbi:MAG: hypothetical protein WC451_03510 [Patescibacteria group bacterium]|jgi:hypothetical protein